MRGTWFVDGTWQPLENNYAERVEKEHMIFFKGHKLPSDKPDPKAPTPGKIRQTFFSASSKASGDFILA